MKEKRHSTLCLFLFHSFLVSKTWAHLFLLLSSSSFLGQEPSLFTNPLTARLSGLLKANLTYRNKTGVFLSSYKYNVRKDNQIWKESGAKSYIFVSCSSDLTQHLTSSKFQLLLYQDENLFAYTAQFVLKMLKRKSNQSYYEQSDENAESNYVRKKKKKFTLLIF